MSSQASRHRSADTPMIGQERAESNKNGLSTMLRLQICREKLFLFRYGGRPNYGVSYSGTLKVNRQYTTSENEQGGTAKGRTPVG